MKPLRGKGVLRYNPKRKGKISGKGWLILDVIGGDDLCQYYCQFAEKHPYYFGETKLDLIRPSWGPHISIVRGMVEKIEKPSLWGKYEGKTLSFTYSTNIKRTQKKDYIRDTVNHGDEFFYIDVQCPEFSRIRKELGLRTHNPVTNKKFTNHITIGRMKHRTK